MPSSSPQNSSSLGDLLDTLESLLSLLETLFSSLPTSQPHQEIKSTVHSENETGEQNRDPSQNVVIRAELQTPKHIERYRKRQDDRNYHIQKCIAIAAWCAFGAAFIYAGISLAIWVEMQAQNKTARQQLEVAVRPWIKITDLKPWDTGPVIPTFYFRTFFDHEAEAPISGSLRFTIGMKNVGHSVAEVFLRSELVIPPWEKFGQILPEEKKRFCSSPQGEEWYPTVMLFPDDPPYEWSQEAAHIVESSSGTRVNGQQIVAAALIVCVDYRIKTAPRRYQTSAIYDVLPQGAGRLRLFPLDVRMAAEQVRLVRNQLHDDAY